MPTDAYFVGKIRDMIQQKESIERKIESLRGDFNGLSPTSSDSSIKSRKDQKKKELYSAQQELVTHLRTSLELLRDEQRTLDAEVRETQTAMVV